MLPALILEPFRSQPTLHLAALEVQAGVTQARSMRRLNPTGELGLESTTWEARTHNRHGEPCHRLTRRRRYATPKYYLDCLSARKDQYPDCAVFLADRKSTRLNSSHVKISYAVFCLKK